MKVLATLGAVAAATLLLAGGTSASNPRSTEKNFQHVFVIMMENTGYNALVGNTRAPWINAAMATYGVAKHYFGVIHRRTSRTTTTRCCARSRTAGGSAASVTPATCSR